MSSIARKMQKKIAKTGGKAVFPAGETTYWNGEPLDPPALKIYGTLVDDESFPDLWYRGEGMIGNRIKAVAVFYGGQEFHLYDEEGQAWRKVTEGRGSPRLASRNVSLKDIQRRNR